MFFYPPQRYVPVLLIMARLSIPPRQSDLSVMTDAADIMCKQSEEVCRGPDEIPGARGERGAQESKGLFAGLFRFASIVYNGGAEKSLEAVRATADDGELSRDISCAGTGTSSPSPCERVIIAPGSGTDPAPGSDDVIPVIGQEGNQDQCNDGSRAGSGDGGGDEVSFSQQSEAEGRLVLEDAAKSSQESGCNSEELEEGSAVVVRINASRKRPLADDLLQPDFEGCVSEVQSFVRGGIVGVDRLKSILSGIFDYYHIAGMEERASVLRACHLTPVITAVVAHDATSPDASHVRPGITFLVPKEMQCPSWGRPPRPHCPWNDESNQHSPGRAPGSPA